MPAASRKARQSARPNALPVSVRSHRTSQRTRCSPSCSRSASLTGAASVTRRQPPVKTGPKLAIPHLCATREWPRTCRPQPPWSPLPTRSGITLSRSDRTRRSACPVLNLSLSGTIGAVLAPQTCVCRDEKRFLSCECSRASLPTRRLARASPPTSPPRPAWCAHPSAGTSPWSRCPRAPAVPALS